MADETPSPPSPAAPADTTVPVTPSSVTTTSRPDWMPESHWDAKTGAPNSDLLKTDFAELGTLRTERDARIASIPKDGAYKLEIPDTIKLPEGSRWEPEANEPITLAALAVFKEHNFTQAQATAVQGLWAGFLLNMQEAENKSRAETQAALGANANVRVDAAKKFLSANKLDALSPALDTKDGVEAVEAVIQTMSGLKIQGLPNNGAPAKPDLNKLSGRRILDIANDPAQRSH